MFKNKCVDVLVGLQFGSEGKGKVVSCIADHYKGSVRVGAPNAGHSIEFQGNIYKMQTIPCAWTNPNCKLYIGAGGMVNLDILQRELLKIPLTVGNRLMIDINTTIVTHEDAEQEISDKLYESIGSTTEGIGEAQSKKVLRRSDKHIAMNIASLQQYLGSVSKELNNMIDRGERILIEGTQGFGLSLNHGYYPYVTSRDVIASSMLSDCGLAPSVVNNVIGVMRTYPIRVHGNSGPMGAEELTWQDVANESGYNTLEERTTVTNRVRRVSRINWDMLQAAVRANRCTSLVITFMDYLDHNDRGCTHFELLSQKGRNFVYEVERRLQVPVKMLSTGPNVKDTIVLA